MELLNWKKLYKSEWLIFAILLGMALLGTWLPIDWTRNLKRPVQAPNYAWLSAGYTLVYSLAAYWLWRQKANFEKKWLILALLVLLPNILNIYLRYTSPLTLDDPRPLFGRDADIGLFYEYGDKLFNRQWPINGQGQYAEYPQLSFGLFWLGRVLSGTNREAFYWIFPSLLLLFQLVAAFGLYASGLKLGANQARAAFLLAAWIAGCPALYLFSYTRFDVIPAAFLAIGIYLAVPANLHGVKGMAIQRQWQIWAIGASVVLVIGGLIKWLPAIVWPYLAAAFWFTNKRLLGRFVGVSIFTSLILTIPFAFLNFEALLYPYKFQASRHLIGESVWFLVQTNLLDPTHAVPDKPWGEPAQILLSNNWLTLIQVGLVGLIFLVSLVRLWRIQDIQMLVCRWAGAGLIAVAVFTLANRIFSPQYLVLLVWVWAIALILRPLSWPSLVLTFGLMGIATAANFEVYLLGAYPDLWQRASLILFGAGFGLSAWLLYRLLSLKD